MLINPYELPDKVEENLRKEPDFARFNQELEYFVEYQYWKGGLFRFSQERLRYQDIVQKDLSEALWVTKVAPEYDGDYCQTGNYYLHIKPRRPTPVGRAWDNFLGWK